MYSGISGLPDVPHFSPIVWSRLAPTIPFIGKDRFNQHTSRFLILK